MQNVHPPTIEAAMPDAALIEKVRSGQRIILIAILLNLSIVGIAFLMPRTGSMMAIFGIFSIVTLLVGKVLALIGVVRLTSGLGYRTPARIFTIFAMFIPLVSLFLLLTLSSRATAVLRAAGYKVGLLGAVPSAA